MKITISQKEKTGNVELETIVQIDPEVGNENIRYEDLSRWVKDTISVLRS